MSSHTPGPWEVTKYSSRSFCLGCPGISPWALIKPLYVDINNPEFRANVRLMTAAPEMKEWIEITIFNLKTLEESDIRNLMIVSGEAILKIIEGGSKQ